SGTSLNCLRGHQQSVTCVAFSPDGQLVVSGSRDETANVWDAQSGALRHSLKGEYRGVQRLALSPDGRFLTSGVKVWDVHRGAELGILRGTASQVQSVAYSPDGLRIAGASYDRAVRVWDGHTFACLEELPGEGDVAAIAAGASRFPWRAMTRGLETVVEEAATGRVAARVPPAPEHI